MAKSQKNIECIVAGSWKVYWFESGYRMYSSRQKPLILNIHQGRPHNHMACTLQSRHNIVSGGVVSEVGRTQDFCTYTNLHSLYESKFCWGSLNQMISVLKKTQEVFFFPFQWITMNWLIMNDRVECRICLPWEQIDISILLQWLTSIGSHHDFSCGKKYTLLHQEWWIELTSLARSWSLLIWLQHEKGHMQHTSSYVGFKFWNMASHLMSPTAVSQYPSSSAAAATLRWSWWLRNIGLALWDGEGTRAMLMPRSVIISLPCFKSASFVCLLNMAPPQRSPYGVVGTTKIAGLLARDSVRRYLARQFLDCLIAATSLATGSGGTLLSFLVSLRISNLCLAMAMPMLWRKEWSKYAMSSSSSSLFVNRSPYS